MALAPYDRKYRCRTDLVMQRSVEDLPPFKLLKKIARGGAEAERLREVNTASPCRSRCTAAIRGVSPTEFLLRSSEAAAIEIVNERPVKGSPPVVESIAS